MTVYLAECVLGVFAFDDEGKMLGSKLFPVDAVKIADKLESVQKGEPIDEHRELIADLIKAGEKEFCLESGHLADKLGKEFKRVKFVVQMPNKAGQVLRSQLREIAGQMGIEEVDELLREVNVLLTRERLRKEAAERDKLIIQTINMLDELDRAINIACGRVREWYSIHFPELDRLVPEHLTYLKLVAELGTRERFTPAAVKTVTKLPQEDAERVASAAASSLGGAFDELDIQALRGCIKGVLALYELREKISEYIDGLMAQVAPNLRAIIGGSIGARLISLAGGLRELARLPASTLQVLGAEKALFRALRTKARPPKHGVIYQYPEVRGAPKWQRGKIARALAGKLSIAARVDAMSGEFVGEKLASDLATRIAEIKMRYQKPGRT